VALLAFAHRMPLLQQPIDISCPPGPQQQTCGSGFDGKTDGHGMCYFTDPARSAYQASSADNLHSLVMSVLVAWSRISPLPLATTPPPAAAAASDRRDDGVCSWLCTVDGDWRPGKQASKHSGLVLMRKIFNS